MLSTPPATKSVAFAGPDRVRGARGGLQPRAAETVHRLSRDLDRQAGEQRGHARDVAVVLARLVGAAEDHVIDPVGRESGAREQAANGRRGEIVGPDLGQRAAGAADRGADGVEDVGVGHGGSMPRGGMAERAGGT